MRHDLRPIRCLACAALLLVPLMRPGTVAGQDALPPAGRVVAAVLRFDARATAGDFSGTTSTASGSYRGGPALDGITGEVETPVRSLVTGKAGRDAHLREALEAEQFPLIRFAVERLAAAGTAGDTLRVTLDGVVTAHGVSRPRTVPAALVRTPGGVRLLATFPMSFREFGIRKHLSKFLGLVKVSDDFVVHVDVTFAGAS